ncbi:MAG: type IV secretory system conjugative DNA transfer family protein, partial [bacterium]
MNLSGYLDLVALVVGAWLLLREVGKKRQNKDTQASDPDLNPLGTLDEREAGQFPVVLMDGDAGPGAALGEQSRFQHTEVVGASGTGKNWFALLPMIEQDIRRGAGVVILDPKSAMRDRVEGFAKAAGRLADLRCLDLAEPSRSTTYSPFLDEHPSHVTERVFSAFYGDDQTPTPHYRNLAKSLLYGFFGLCQRLEVLPTLDQLRAVALDQMLLAALVAKAPTAREARELRTQFLSLDRKEYAAILQGLANALTDMTTARYAPLLNTTAPGVDLRDVLAQGRILYVGLAADLYQTSFRRVSTLLLMDLQSGLTARYGRAVRPMFLYLDEFADLIHPQIGALIAKAREARMGITLAHQSLGDLKRFGDALA